jgi:hypothetical protein
MPESHNQTMPAAETFTPSGPATTNVATRIANLQTEAIASLGLCLSAKSQPALKGEAVLVVSNTAGTVSRLSQVLPGFQFSAPTTLLDRVSSVQALNAPHSTRRSSHRSLEMEFLRSHPEIFARYVGEWVALEGEQIVAHGRDPAKVVAAARRAGVKIPFIFRVQPKLAANAGTLGP